MKRPKRGAPRVLREIKLPHGVTLHARTLTPFVSARLDAQVERELTALVRGEDSEFPWGLDAEQQAAIASDYGVRKHYADWMRLVLLAFETVERVEGVFEEDGAASTTDFDLFAGLLEEEAAAEVFRQAAILLAVTSDDEKNVSGRGPRGRSAAAPNTAPDAAPETIPSSGNPAPAASPSPISTASESAAPMTNTPPPPVPAPSPGGLPVQAEAGSTASAVSLDSIGQP